MATSSETNGHHHLANGVSPLDRVQTNIQSDNGGPAFWWEALSQPLQTLLQTSKYSEDDQLYYLRWFNQHITPSLGPAPVNGQPHYGAWLTYDGSRLEYSLNWKEKKPDQTIRFTLEPCSERAGTAADPLNQQAAGDLLASMAKDVPGIDLARFNLFASETRVPDEAADEIRAKNPLGAPLTGTWVAFDLERGTVVAKAYFLPHLRAVLTGTPTKTIVFDAIRKCNGPSGNYDGSIGVLDDYLESFGSEEAPQVVLLSNDCVPDSPTCRNKVYVHAAIGSLAHAKDMFSLGGRLTGPLVAKGLEAVAGLWYHLFDLDASDPNAESTVVWEDGRKFLCVYEMKPTPEGEAVTDMEVKLHLPGWRLGKTDQKVGERLSSWFEKHGHADLAARYQPDLASAFPKHTMDSSYPGTHTWISITWTPKTGLYMTMYYTPKIPELYYQCGSNHGV